MRVCRLLLVVCLAWMGAVSGPVTPANGIGVHLVKIVRPGTHGLRPFGLTDANGMLFFFVVGPKRFELWRSDGSGTGTVLLTKLGSRRRFGPFDLTSLNGGLYFTNDFAELWRSDGSAVGTRLVKRVFGVGIADDCNDVDISLGLTPVNGALFFRAADSSGVELWKSDGTAAGTGLLKDVNPAGNSLPDDFTDVRGTLFFTAFDPVHGRELWRSDGTAAGTVLVKDISQSRCGSSPQSLTDVHGTLFFTAFGSDGVQLWRSDGTASGTVLVKDANDRFEDWFPDDLTDVGGTLFFTAFDPVHGRELWRSDGTAAGTVLVRDIRPHRRGSDLGELTDVNGNLFFRAADGRHGRELWRSDGTAGGTKLVKDIYRGRQGSLFFGVDDLTNVNGRLFFVADDGSHGRELWTSDGTARGTALVRDIHRGKHSSFGIDGIPELTNVDGTLFFNATARTHRTELWKSDPIN